MRVGRENREDAGSASGAAEPGTGDAGPCVTGVLAPGMTRLC